MSEPLTDEEIAELRAADEACSKNWRADGRGVLAARIGPDFEHGDGTDYVATFEGDSRSYEDHETEAQSSSTMRNAFPRLLDEIEQNRRANAAFCEVLEASPTRILVKGLDAPPIDQRLMNLLQATGEIYLHRSADGHDGWIVLPARSSPADGKDDAPQVITLLLSTPETPDKLERAKKLLGEMEWSLEGDGCHGCSARRPDGHVPDCELAALIGKT